MSINLSDDMRQALKAGDKKKLSALRLLVSALRQKEIDERRELGEEEQIQLLARLAKQRQESIAQFKTAERQDLVDKEQYELDLIRSYLPQPLDEKTLSGLVDKTMADLHAGEMKDMGKVMQALKKEVAGRADMGALSRLVREKLAAS